MSTNTVSIALPVLNAGGSLSAAVRCIQAQTFDDLDIQIVLNGSNAETTAVAHDLAASDSRVRVLSLPRANLAAALNVALSCTSAQYVARMDADDTCTPDRIVRQLEHMNESPQLGALGCAWEAVDASGTLVATHRPPTCPAEARWRLLMGNPFAHGSMMLRRQAVLACGGYRESRTRAQDYDLWLRLSRQHGVAALQETMYRHYLRSGAPTTLLDEQSRHAAQALIDAWRLLPAGTDGDNSLADHLGGTLTSAERLAAIEASLAASGPTIEGMLAWFWSQWRTQPQKTQVNELCRQSRLREVGAMLRERGAHAVWLYGAGRHTSWLMQNAHHLGLSIEGIIDDYAAGQQRGPFTVLAPAALEPPADVLISTDWHEQEVWEAGAPLRARGIRTWRIYQGLESQQRSPRSAELASLLTTLDAGIR